jgi:hypothetical protein
MHHVLQLLVLLSVLMHPSVSYAEASRPLTCRVVDAETGTLLPCRVYVESAEGEWYFAQAGDESGSAVEYDVARSPESFEKHTTVSAHPFVFDLPPGRYDVVVERGKEYHPKPLTVTMDDEPVKRTIRLRRWIDMAKLGWYSGDTHVHRSLDDLPNVMRAEDLNVALPLSYWVRDAYIPPSQGDKSVPVTAELIPVDRDHVIWPMNTEYEIFTVNGKRHTLGAVFVLNHQEPLAPVAPPVAPIADAARQQHSLLDLDKHSWPWSMMLVPIMNVDLFELTNNHIWRTEFFYKKWTIEQLPHEWNIETDANGFTEWGWIDFGFKSYYALLNCGFPMRPTAGTASGVHPVPLGFGRVYVHLPDGFNYGSWIAGLDAGRSFVTTGPMLFAQFDGKQPGTTFDFTKTTSIRVHGSVENSRPLSRVEIIKNGDVVHVIRATNESRCGIRFRTTFDEQIEVEGSSWIAVRCFSPQPTGSRLRFAHTAPVHVNVAGHPLRPRKFETGYLVKSVQAELQRNRGVLSDDELAEYQRALEIYSDLDAIALPGLTSANGTLGK